MADMILYSGIYTTHWKERERERERDKLQFVSSHGTQHKCYSNICSHDYSPHGLLNTRPYMSHLRGQY